MSTLLNIVFQFYFITHIPITILLDSQAIFPDSYYPKSVTGVMQFHINEFKDPLMADPPIWLQTFIVIECLLQLPFFFFASYAFIKGIKKCKWVKLPCIVYAAHVATTVVPILAHLALTDFSNATIGPKTDKERLILIAIYIPYLVIPVMLLFYVLALRFDEPQTKSKRH
ncbi:Transmembrane protein 97 [Trichoplax sp. H2]|uniref:Sigma intracellular receptor 2 n=1 Tax=Trichoplax adhaerens TaxID=10228 RepID=B3RYX2_TRIAD|nr:hypothetical protein TRIADDRAFT_26143 [Trichoplax adhaerens]EDV23745.1 hypothetical protein TRIADDRAFT_26143 [Trichoplax adhaerens]RDD40702.1 Transmembrane protein 97 [Trichoplax sp. H2]|eukprot:XP_002113271.1 hypothetical protein TRIADDRAFT_26143 [Trichoplax adhaerens]